MAGAATFRAQARVLRRDSDVRPDARARIAPTIGKQVKPQAALPTGMTRGSPVTRATPMDRAGIPDT